MKNPRIFVRLVVVFTALSMSGLATAIGPYPLEYFALREVMRNVNISPDGKHLLLLATASKDGNAVLEVYDAADLDKKPFRVNAEPMEIRSARWLSDDDILINLRQKVRNKIQDFNEGVYETRIARLDVNKKKMKIFDQPNVVVENVLPNDPNKIIISLQPSSMSDVVSRLAEAFRPRAYYLFDLKKGTKSLLIRGNLDIGNIEFDENGKPWLARGFDRGTGDFVWYRRYKDEKGWKEFHRWSEDSPEQFVVQGLDPDDPDSVLVTSVNGNDKVGLWAFNTRKKEYGELIYRRNDVDVRGVRFHSNPWTQQDTIVAVRYDTDKAYYEYFDDIEAATYAQLEGMVPEAHRVVVTSRSRDGLSLTIFNDGPTDPGSYYLIKDGAMKKVGSQQPLLAPDLLANVDYISYEARDGRMIAGFVTTPHGDAPFPLIVMPHGGPFVAETVIYDEWAQMLANNGYMVLQPQYRGSLGYGLDHYISAIEGGGQGGYKMQDDKDDGAMYLVEQGLVDENRMAMYGWSYGGYAALVAASRTPQIYQCVIAGAAVSDNAMQVNYYRNQLRGHGRDQQLAMWDDSISPIEEVEKVNVPILLIHGSVDQRVPPAHARKYVALLKKYGKDYKFVELDGADHFSSTLFFEHQIELYTSIIDYLKNDCGPGGI